METKTAMATPAAVTALAALAQATRLEIFRLLIQAGPAGLTPGEIAQRLGIPPSSLSFHLKELSRAALLLARPAGRHIHYSANYPIMNALLGFLTESCCGGNPCHNTRATCCGQDADTA
jgi:DNA-binding transcriptional ArsR family regulator